MSPETEEDLILITRERSQLVDMKTHILRSHGESKNSIRNLMGFKISHRTPQEWLEECYQQRLHRGETCIDLLKQ
jgi:hypothetical protein